MRRRSQDISFTADMARLLRAVRGMLDRGLQSPEIERALGLTQGGLNSRLSRCGFDLAMLRDWPVEDLADPRPPRERACLCCGERFSSQGPGHRMCEVCRGRADEAAFGLVEREGAHGRVER